MDESCPAKLMVTCVNLLFLMSRDVLGSRGIERSVTSVLPCSDCPNARTVVILKENLMLGINQNLNVNPVCR